MCVLSEREITRGEVIVHARVVGGLQMVDGGEADDKIVGVLVNDLIWGSAGDISELPRVLIERLEHYFLTYKLVPGQPAQASIFLFAPVFSLRLLGRETNLPAS